MKRVIIILLSFLMLLSACGDRLREPVTFYYVRSSYDEDMSTVVGTEEREASGHRDDLSYLLALYFMGPVSENLISPFPKSTALLDIRWDKAQVTLVLSDTAATLTDAQFSLGSGCLSLTATEISGATTVTVISGERSVTLDSDSILLLDQTASTVEETQ